jgi:hypothetical protein
MAVTPDDLVQLEEIKRLKYRYLRCLDLKEWEELEGCFVPEASASYGGGAYELEGRDAIMAFLREVMGSTEMLTSHRCHHPEIDRSGPDDAEGVWAMDDMVIHGDAGLTISGAAFYRDRYVRRDGRWLIAHTGYRRVFEQVAPRDQGVRLTAQWWATDGRSTLGPS